MYHKSIAPCSMALMVDSMGFGLVYPLMTTLFASEQNSHIAEGLSLNLRQFYLGLGFLLFPLNMFFGASFMGDLSDMIGRKKALILCMSGSCISFLLMGIGVTVSSISLLLIGRSFSGLMAGSQPIAQAAIIDLSTPETKPRNLSLMTLVISIGVIIGPLIGGICSDPTIISWFNLSTPFYFAAFLALLSALWIYTSFGETFFHCNVHRLNWMRPIRILIEGFQNIKIRSLALIFLLMQVGYSLYYQLIQVLMITFFNYSSWQLGMFNGYIGLSFTIITLTGIQFFLKKMNIGVVAISTLGLTGISIILAMLFPMEKIIWIFSFFTAGFDMLAYAALMTCFSNTVDDTRQGWVMGIFGSIMAVSWTITGFSTNFIHLLNLQELIIIGGLCMILSAILMLFYTINKPISSSYY